VKFDFEDGTTDGWTLHYGPATVANETSIAYSGTHALGITLTGAGNPAIGSPTSNLTGIVSGTKVTYEVYEPSSISVGVQPYAVDNAGNYDFIPTIPLKPGWNTITWTVPTLVSGISFIAMEVENGGGAVGTIDFDAVNWS
jgi:hypothetical protein